ncbi:MAG: hypothetical protein JSV89_17895 [Spirochaetaceae bacterium]|nr:MAG: hypothetical protein JSV89_17895 [Spirochaetaceae bacterium]
MLRAQAFEGLFTLLPILLVAVVSVILRARAARRRKQREEAAQSAKTTQSPSSVQKTDRAAETGRKPAPRLGSQFPWLRESAEIYPPPTGPASASSTASPAQQPPRPQVASRESYAYPPPLSLNDLKNSTATGAQAQSRLIPRPTVLPESVERAAVRRESLMPDGVRQTAVDRDTRLPERVSRMAGTRRAVPRTVALPDGKSWMAVPLQERRQRMKAREDSGVGETKAAAARPSTIAARLEKLPPLKRAVIWAEILGPPGGRE